MLIVRAYILNVSHNFHDWNYNRVEGNILYFQIALLSKSLIDIEI
jgi:hypothetical protein